VTGGEVTEDSRA